MKRIIRERQLTVEEADKYQTIRDQLAAERIDEPMTPTPTLTPRKPKALLNAEAALTRIGVKVYVQRRTPGASPIWSVWIDDKCRVQTAKTNEAIAFLEGYSTACWDMAWDHSVAPAPRVHACPHCQTGRCAIHGKDYRATFRWANGSVCDTLVIEDCASADAALEHANAYVAKYYTGEPTDSRECPQPMSTSIELLPPQA